MSFISIFEVKWKNLMQEFTNELIGGFIIRKVAS